MGSIKRGHLRSAGGRRKSIDAAIGELSDDALQCRDFGHSWRPYQADWIPQRRQYLERLMCARCATERVRLLGAHGEQLGNRYVYPDGYLVAGVGRLTGADRDAVRLASLQTVLVLLDTPHHKGA